MDLSQKEFHKSVHTKVNKIRQKRSKDSNHSNQQSPESPADLENAENASVMSVASDGGHSSNHVASGEEVPAEADTTETEVNGTVVAEDAFSDALDGLAASSCAGREKALSSMRKLLQMKCYDLVNVISKNYETLNDALTSCVKRGKNNECMLAAQCMSLLCMQLVNLAECDVEKFYVDHLKPVLRQILTDDSFRPEDRSAIAASLGLACYSCCDDLKEVESAMAILESVFVGSALKGDGTVRQVTPQQAHLHQSALLSWAVLFSRDCVFVADSTLAKITELLQSPDLDVRISAGETLALVYELRRQSVATYRLFNHRDLCDRLQSMAHEGQKSKAKKDLRIQRSNFRDIAHYIDGSCRELDVENVKIDRTDSLELVSWGDKLMYHVLCGVFGSGLKHQLQENSYIREHIFGLDPYVPVQINPSEDKTMKNELKRCRRQEDQARCLARQKGRTKRVASFSAQ